MTIRGHRLPILPTNPLGLDSEQTTHIHDQTIPLSADDGTVAPTPILKGLEVISTTREKLRKYGKLTNCEARDRTVLVKSSTLQQVYDIWSVQGQVHS